VQKESEILQLDTTLVKSISAQLTNYEKTLYNQLGVLYENKPVQTIKTIFHNLEEDFKNTNKTIAEKIQGLQLPELKEAELFLKGAREPLAEIV